MSIGGLAVIWLRFIENSDRAECPTVLNKEWCESRIGV